jgi:hypothetical protein
LLLWLSDERIALLACISCAGRIRSWPHLYLSRKCLQPAKDATSDICPYWGVRSAVWMGSQSLERRTARSIEIRSDSKEMDRTIGRACSNPANRGIRSLKRPVSSWWLAVVQIVEARAVLERLLVDGERDPRPTLVLRPGARGKGVAVLNGDGQRPVLSYVDVLASGDFGDLSWSVMSKTDATCIPDTANRRRPCLCHSGTQ